MYFYLICFCSCSDPDLGHGELDGSNQVKVYEQPSLNTTKYMLQEINRTDLIVHIGDLSYAVGYAAQVLYVLACNPSFSNWCFRITTSLSLLFISFPLFLSLLLFSLLSTSPIPSRVSALVG